MQWGPIMKDETLLGPWVRRFLLEHLVAERNLSRNTQASYRDTLMLLLPFVSNHGGRAIDRMTVEDLTPSVIRKFLDYLERDRQCSGVTRNQRLATIRSLARFIGMRSPVHVAWCAEIRAMPFKKTAKTVIGYLEKAEMDALLAQPDLRTSLGNRDHALLLFLYNSGARADEVAKLTINNLQLGAQSAVRLHGKGNKFRSCPLWPVTATSLSKLVADRDKNGAVFLNRVNQPLTRFGIHRLVTQYAELASRTTPSLATKRVSPHTIRHTTAVHLLRAGVDINTIRAWLGHVSLNTTHVYAEVDMEMKAKALARVDISDLQTKPRQRTLPSLTAFLKAL
jgi:site-specific recombinase XerD